MISKKKFGDSVGWGAHFLSPREISEGKLGRTSLSLSVLEHNATIVQIKNLLRIGVKVAEIHVRKFGDSMWYQKELEKQFPKIRITMTKKADRDCAVMNAASIYAKVLYTNVLKKIVAQYPKSNASRELPSGYPKDQKTIEFVNSISDDVFGCPDVERFSWKTSENLRPSLIPIVWYDDKQDSPTLSNDGRGRLFTTLKIVTEF